MGTSSRDQTVVRRTIILKVAGSCFCVNRDVYIAVMTQPHSEQSACSERMHCAIRSPAVLKDRVNRAVPQVSAVSCFVSRGCKSSIIDRVLHTKVPKRVFWRSSSSTIHSLD